FFPSEPRSLYGFDPSSGHQGALYRLLVSAEQCRALPYFPSCWAALPVASGNGNLQPRGPESRAWRGRGRGRRARNRLGHPSPWLFEAGPDRCWEYSKELDQFPALWYGVTDTKKRCDNGSSCFYHQASKNPKPKCHSPLGAPADQFRQDQTSLEIYEYQGCQAAEDLLQGYEGEILSNGNDQRSVNIRGRLFERFFVLLHITNVAANGEHLNRECSLFTDDCRCVIVGSAAYLPDEPHPPFFEVYRNSESVTPNPRSPLEDYSLHIIDLHTGRLCDTRTFKCDKVVLSHNQGLYLYKNILAILSVQQQTIHVFQVTPEGTFIDVRTIGRFCYEDDLLTVSAVFPEVQRDSQTGMANPFRDPFINSLKHRLLVYLWRRAEQDGSAMAKRRFFQYFDQLRQLRMWKMQLLDENHLFIKYTSEDVVTLRVTDPSQASFFVVYNMVTTEVIAVFENTSDELLELFENFCDLFRNATLHSEVQFPCSASSNNFARQIQRRFKDTIINAKYGGHTEAVRRLLGQLPISAQSYSGSPYLDLSLFSYDDKWVSVMERPKTCGDHPIRSLVHRPICLSIHGACSVCCNSISRRSWNYCH
uniref:DET1 partner of COP1 E3 ubiquitin ligase n=1 Tax=Piliocolobus tephrosceles TaxID=591936 RepID=A0A8C9LHD6_9PRIM